MTDRLFVAISRYLRPLADVDARRADHWAWVQAAYGDGRLLASGRQDPPDGGVLVGRAAGEDDVRAWLAGDPFVVHGLAEYDVRLFAPGPAPLRSMHVDRFRAEGTSRLEPAGDPAAIVVDPPTSRQRVVLGLMAEGATIAEIGQRLHLSPETIKDEASQIYRKLRARNRAQAIIRADRRGWLSTPHHLRTLEREERTIHADA